MENLMKEFKIKNLEESAINNLNRIKESRKVSPWQFKKILAFYLGSELHEDWKEEDKLAYENASEDEKIENWQQSSNGELRKFMSVDEKMVNLDYKDPVFVFEEGNPAYNKKERKVDVRALNFDELPFVVKIKYIEIGSWLMDLCYDGVMFDGEDDVDKLLSKSEAYEKLPEETKEKYKRYGSLALNLLNNIKEGNITLGKILDEKGLSMSRFDVQMEKIRKKYVKKNPDFDIPDFE